MAIHLRPSATQPPLPSLTHSIDEFSIKSKNFVEIKAFENFKLAFTTVNEDFEFSSNAEIDEIGLYKPAS